jgi:DNA-binding winged helix-turn-helix (wHTH) protein
MTINWSKGILYGVIGLLSLSAHAVEGNDQDERLVQVAMRMIGHEILLSTGDSTSVVAPISKVGDRYLIQFDTKFVLDPNDIIVVIDSVVANTHIASSYLVEVEKCDTNAVVYSYQVGDSTDLNVIPCRSREQALDCYNVFFTILTSGESRIDLANNAADDSPNLGLVFGLLCILLILALVGFYFWKKKPKINPNLITIGEYHFDKLNSELLLQGQKVELTSKESDLLLLLYNSANTTIEREEILKNVWGDDGDYVGRTLDVFISKLRKKLEVDTNVKIVNIRGIGYKLIVNDQK